MARVDGESGSGEVGPDRREGPRRGAELLDADRDRLHGRARAREKCESRVERLIYNLTSIVKFDEPDTRKL